MTMKHFVFAVALLVFFVLLSASYGEDIITIQIHNDDIDWDGSFVGLKPSLKGGAKRIVDADFDVQAKLRYAFGQLADEKRFIAAHVILAKLTGKGRHCGDRNVKEWYGLRVVLFSDGSVRYSSKDAAKLRQKWKRVLTFQDP